MRKVMICALALMLACVCALAEPATLTVNGTGVVSMDPDTATIVVGVRQTSPDVAEAQAAVSAKMQAVIDALLEAGISRENLHTSHINLYEDYSYDSTYRTDEPHYAASNSIYVAFDDLDNAGKYIDLVFSAGANTFEGISFSAKDTKKEQNRALELAVEDARAKAEVLAAAAGMKLGGVLSIREGSYGGGSYIANGLYAKAEESVAMDAATPVMADKLQVTASVSVDFEMVE